MNKVGLIAAIVLISATELQSYPIIDPGTATSTILTTPLDPACVSCLKFCAPCYLWALAGCMSKCTLKCLPAVLNPNQRAVVAGVLRQKHFGVELELTTDETKEVGSFCVEMAVGEPETDCLDTAACGPCLPCIAAYKGAKRIEKTYFTVQAPEMK